MGRVATFKVVYRDVHVLHRMVERHVFGQQFLAATVECFAGFLVDVGQYTLGVIIGHVHHRCREYRLVAQHVVLGLSLYLQLFRLVVCHAYNHGGFTVLRASEY